MNKEDYVSLEVAKLLKEKGFDEICSTCYYYHDNEWILQNGNNKNSANGKDWLSRPTLYDAHKWLREKYNIDVLPTIREESLPKKDYCCYIYKDAKIVHCKVAYGEDFYECMNDSLLEVLKNIL